MKDIEWWNEILEGELAFAKFMLDVLIIVAAIYTGGLAGGVIRGLFGEALSLGGRLAVGALAFGAEVTAFTLTSRGLRWAIYGENFKEGFAGELAENALLFGLLKGAGKVYGKFGAPRLPASLRTVGAMTTTFAAFQTWAIGHHAWKNEGELIGLTDPRFWKLVVSECSIFGCDPPGP